MAATQRPLWPITVLTLLGVAAVAVAVLTWHAWAHHRWTALVESVGGSYSEEGWPSGGAWVDISVLYCGSLADSQLVEVVRALGANGALRSIDLEGQAISVELAEAIARTTATDVNLARCSIDTAAIEALVGSGSNLSAIACTEQQRAHIATVLEQVDHEAVLEVVP